MNKVGLRVREIQELEKGPSRPSRVRALAAG